MNRKASSHLFGASVLVLAATAQAASPMPVVELWQRNAGETLLALLQLAGEGGEGGAGQGTATEAADFMLSLYFLEGLLRSGWAAYEAADPDSALAHYGAFAEALNGPLGHSLAAQGFEREHVAAEAAALPLAIRQKEPAAEVHDLHGHMLHELDEHAVQVDPNFRRTPGLVRHLVVALVREAAARYEAASVQGGLVDKLAYQRGRGLVWTARDLLGAAASALRERDAAGFEALLTAFDALQATWTAIEPPKTPVPASVVLGETARIELALSGLVLEPLPPAGEGREAGEAGEGGERG